MLKRKDLERGRMLWDYAEERAKSKDRPMSRLEAFVLSEKISECYDGTPTKIGRARSNNLA